MYREFDMSLIRSQAGERNEHGRVRHYPALGPQRPLWHSQLTPSQQALVG